MGAVSNVVEDFERGLPPCNICAAYEKLGLQGMRDLVSPQSH